MSGLDVQALNDLSNQRYEHLEGLKSGPEAFSENPEVGDWRQHFHGKAGAVLDPDSMAGLS